jgi:indole-3-glycerol phosphate synthase
MASRFLDALVASPLPIIMEVKRSDAEGVELIGDRPIEQIVSEYVAAGAPCISVVTGRWFGGEEQMLVEVAGLTDLPLLQKDFITREKQLIRAKEIGASAVLLTARILPKSTFRHMIEATLRHELTPFVEIADHEELASVVHAEQCIVAINNKDIRTQERGAGDLDRSRSLLDAVIDSGTPVPASASAITDPKIAAELVSSGFKALLIGTGLLQADSIKGWIDSFERHRSAQAA